MVLLVNIYEVIAEKLGAIEIKILLIKLEKKQYQVVRAYYNTEYKGVSIKYGVNYTFDDAGNLSVLSYERLYRYNVKIPYRPANASKRWIEKHGDDAMRQIKGYK